MPLPAGPVRKKVRKSAHLMMILFTLFLFGCTAQPEQPEQSEPAIEKSVNSYTQLGFAYLERNNTDRAKRAFVKALTLDDEAPDALHGMALIYQQEGEKKLAEEHFEKALDEGGQFSIARNNFAAFLYEQKRYAEACEQLKITVKDTLYTNRQLAFENLGLCQLRLGQTAEAERSFKRALQLDRNSGRALLELASLKYVQNSPLDAWGYLRQHLKVAKASERGLMLGIRLAEQLGKNAERSRYLSELSRLKQAH